MAGTPKSMSQIKQLIQLHQQGKSIKSIARSLAMSKNTVKAYLEKLACSKIDIELKKHVEFEKHFLVTNIKEKWGGLCFNVMTATDAIYNAIDQAETHSLITCEICGKKAGPKRIRGWISTLCWFHSLLHKWRLLK